MHASTLTPPIEPLDHPCDIQSATWHEAELRRYRPQDAPAVMAAYRCLSPDTFYRRFFTHMPDRAGLVGPLLERVDHRDHEVFLAWIDTSVVGIAQWDRSSTDPTSAEIAVVVTDVWQHRGIGTRLLEAIATDARRSGITELSADIMTTNMMAMSFARSIGPTDRSVDGAETHVTFRLTGDGGLGSPAGIRAARGAEQ